MSMQRRFLLSITLITLLNLSIVVIPLYAETGPNLTDENIDTINGTDITTQVKHYKVTITQTIKISTDTSSVIIPAASIQPINYIRILNIIYRFSQVIFYIIEGILGILTLIGILKLKYKKRPPFYDILKYINGQS